MDEPIDIEEYIDIDRNEEIYSSTDENVLFQEIVDTINHIDALEEEEPSEERIINKLWSVVGVW